jgi:uncharacterized protein YraI
MIIKTRLRFLSCLLLIWGFLTACGISAQDRVATRVAEEEAVAQTLTARAVRSQPTTPSQRQASTVPAESAVQPTATAALTPQTDQASHTTVATPTTLPEHCTIVTDLLNLRDGPGVAYDPPIVTLDKGTLLQPVAYSYEGYPGGRWIKVQVLTNGFSGWTSADPQFVNCNLDITQLPPADYPSPPRVDLPKEVPVPTSVVALYRMDSSLRSSNIFWRVAVPGFSSDELDGNDLVFQDQLVFRIDAYNKKVSTINGAGIDQVHIRVSKTGGGFAYETNEGRAPYCFAPSDSYSCQPWVFADHNYQWPNGETIEDGEHRVTVLVDAKDGSRSSGWFTFRIERPIASQQVGSDCVIVYQGADGLNLRAGPGVNYDPPIIALYQGTSVTPLGRNQDGSWIKVTQPGRGLTGWVKVESQFGPYVRCNLSISGLPYLTEATQPTNPEDSNTKSVENALRDYYALIAQRRYDVAWAMVSEYNIKKGLSYGDYERGWEESGSATIVEPIDVIDGGSRATVILKLYYPKRDVQHKLSYELERDERRGDPQFGYWLFVKGTLIY